MPSRRLTDFLLFAAVFTMSFEKIFWNVAGKISLTEVISICFVVAYLLVAGEVFLATAVHGVFRMSVGGIGPTELRIVLAAGAVALLNDPHVSVGPLTVRLFDFGGAIAAVGLIGAFVVSVVRNATALAVAEPR